MKIFTRSLQRKLLFTCLILTSLLGISQATGFQSGTLLKTVYPEWFDTQSFSSFSDKLDAARREGKQGVMVVFSTAECSYCNEFIRNSLNNPEIAAEVRDHFHAVGMEIFADPDKMTDANGKVLYASEFARKESSGYSPTIVFYGKDGNRLLRLVGYQSPERFKKTLGRLAQGA